MAKVLGTLSVVVSLTFLGCVPEGRTGGRVGDLAAEPDRSVDDGDGTAGGAGTQADLVGPGPSLDVGASRDAGSAVDEMPAPDREVGGAGAMDAGSRAADQVDGSAEGMEVPASPQEQPPVVIEAVPEPISPAVEEPEPEPEAEEEEEEEEVVPLREVRVRSFYADPVTDAPDVLVFVSAPDGSLIDQGRTGHDGRVVVIVPAGSMVTAASEVVYVSESGERATRELYSVLDVPASGAIMLNGSPPRTVDGGRTVEDPVMTLNVSLVSWLDGSPARGSIEIPCATSGGVANELSDGRFSGLRTFEEVGQCYRSEAEHIDVWGFVGDRWGVASVSFFEGATRDVIVEASNSQYRTSTLEILPWPSDVSRLDFTLWGARAQGSAGLPASLTLVPPSTDEPFSVRLPDYPFHSVTVSGSLQFAERERRRVDARFLRTMTEVPSVVRWNPTADLAVFEYLSEPDRLDPQRPTVSWRLSEAGPLGDHLWIRMGWPSGAWSAYMPPSYAGTVQLPALPPEIALGRPNADGRVWAQALHADALELEGYADHVMLGDAVGRRGNTSSISIW